MKSMGLKVIDDKNTSTTDDKVIHYYDLSEEVQIALLIFNVLPDKVEGMSGSWLGKDFSGIEFIFNMYCNNNTEYERKYIFELLLYTIAEAYEYYKKTQSKQNRKELKSGR